MSKFRYYSPDELEAMIQEEASRIPAPPPVETEPETRKLDFSECEAERVSRSVYATERFGAALTKEVKKLGVTRTEIARRAPVADNNFFRHRNGEQRPSKQTWERIKRAMLEIEAEG